MTPAELARLRADLVDALHRREELQHRWAVAELTSSGTDDPAALDVAIAQVDATIAELEERLAGVEGAALAPALPAPTTPAPAGAGRRYLTTAEMAERLGVTPKALERMRGQRRGPAFERVGRAVRYPVDD